MGRISARERVSFASVSSCESLQSHPRKPWYARPRKPVGDAVSWTFARPSQATSTHLEGGLVSSDDVAERAPLFPYATELCPLDLCALVEAASRTWGRRLMTRARRGVERFEVVCAFGETVDEVRGHFEHCLLSRQVPSSVSVRVVEG